MSRPIHQIAAEIKDNWNEPYLGAVPYLKAMMELDTINDTYGCDTARSIVLYFLENAKHWRGDVARRVKVELKTILYIGYVPPRLT